MLLLDTCTLLWLTSDPSHLSKKCREQILRHSGDLFISSISAFEIGLKSQKGLLELPLETQEWFDKSLEYHGINEISVTSDIAIHSTQLPPLHRDPCDRMIIATSKIHDLIILTPDSLIQQYPQVKVIW